MSPNPAEKFGTYLRDATGLDYAQHRYYAFNTSRFMSADPYSASSKTITPLSWNRYEYVIGDPVNYHDPSGLDYIVPSGGSFDPKDPRNICSACNSIIVSSGGSSGSALG